MIKIQKQQSIDIPVIRQVTEYELLTYEKNKLIRVEKTIQQNTPKTVHINNSPAINKVLKDYYK